MNYSDKLPCNRPLIPVKWEAALKGRDYFQTVLIFIRRRVLYKDVRKYENFKKINKKYFFFLQNNSLQFYKSHLKTEVYLTGYIYWPPQPLSSSTASSLIYRGIILRTRDGSIFVVFPTNLPRRKQILKELFFFLKLKTDASTK